MKKGKLSVAGAALCAALLICSQASAAAVSKADKPDKKPRKPEPVPNQLLVSFKSGASSSDIAALHSSAKGKVLKKISRIGVELVEVPVGSNLADTIKAYKKNPKVAFAEPNYRRSLTALPPPMKEACRTFQIFSQSNGICTTPGRDSAKFAHLT